jgi:4-hydroxybenzoate polyprenyltransferase
MEIKMSLIRITAAIVTLLLLIVCLILMVITALSGNWSATFVIFMICCGFSIFTYNDYLKFFVDKK